jgi:hypothetical protein
MIYVTIEGMETHVILIVIRFLPDLSKIMYPLHIMKPVGCLFFGQLEWQSERNLLHSAKILEIFRVVIDLLINNKRLLHRYVKYLRLWCISVPFYFTFNTTVKRQDPRQLMPLLQTSMLHRQVHAAQHISRSTFRALCFLDVRLIRFAFLMAVTYFVICCISGCRACREAGTDLRAFLRNMLPASSERRWLHL